MKKRIFVLSVALIFQAMLAHAAEPTKTDKNVADYRFRIVVSGKQRSSGTMSVGLGTIGSIQEGVTVSYVSQSSTVDGATPQDCWAVWPIARCKAETTSSLRVEPIESGVKLAISPGSLRADGGVNTSIRLSLTDLVEMRTVESSDLAVEAPKVITGSLATEMAMHQGDKIVQTIPFPAGGADAATLEVELVSIH